MRNRQDLTSKHRRGIATAVCMEQEPRLGAPEDLVAAAVEALNDIGNIVSHQCFTNPQTMTQDRITAYALALMRLRERASAAGLGRLMNACDALAVTVSHLIEDRGRACREKCATLTRFVVHAEAMIQMATDSARTALPIPDIRTPSHRVGAERDAGVTM
ncbi:MAG: hypothetical protein ACM3KD_08310 [Hyphomicrobiaceae bacterium]